MKNHYSRIILTSLSCTVMCLTCFSCSRDNADTAVAADNAEWHNCVPASSDLMIVADLDELRNSEWYSAGAADEQNQKLIEKAGFSYEDIAKFVATADLDSMPSLKSLKNAITINASGQPDASALSKDDVKGINVTVLLALKKRITWDQAEAAVDVLFSAVTNATITHLKDDQAIVVNQATSPMPLRITLSKGATTIILKTGETPDDSERHEPGPSLLFAKEQSLKTSGPVRAVMSASPRMRQKLKRLSNGEDTSAPHDAAAVLLKTALKSFASFSGFALTMTPLDKLVQIYGEIELGSQQDALEAETAINNILIPLITLSLTQYSQDAQQRPLLQQAKTDVQANKLIFSASIVGQQNSSTTPSGQ